MVRILKLTLFYLTIFLGFVVILISLLTLLHDLSYWYSKVIDFPRLQYLIVALFCLAGFLLLNKKWKVPAFLLVAGLFTAITIQSLRIFPYFLGTKTVPDAPEVVDKGNVVKVLIANVFIENRKSEELLQIIRDSSPDIILAMEVNRHWIKELEVLEENYPHTITYPTENAYGMALYSKLPFEDQEIEFFKHDSVPSFHMKVNLPSGKSFKFHAVHPVPPVPSEKYPDNVGEQEVALLKTADKVAKDTLPSLVAGDFNDVSWSYTSRLFEDTGNLKNVRIGRGLYNSFDAQSVIMRWPLDHFFVTEGFSVLRLEKLPEFGSDHFPMLAELVVN
ncbi:endonuclease/exonuclease/phosphatase family protein [Salinimicrobium sp. GXAS 041]|uniref:endonuclease/exonuclease/phosphatase family protein n=1 Tax=Salinimicrobium sp. GXAS 041 TaxID=3400806 RepID=UPI003C760E21